MKWSKALAAIIAVAPLVGFAPAHATLTCTIQVDGTTIAGGTCPASNSGSISFSGSDAPLFSSISLTGNGSPDLPQPDLSSVTLDVTASSTFTGTHTLDVDLFQTNVAAPVGTMLETTATINSLIGLPGPTTLSDFINGTDTTLGTTLRSSTFPTTFTGAIGPFIDTLTVPLTADAHQFAITFSAADQSANDTIQLQGISPGSVPEPSSFALLWTGLLSLGFVLRRRNSG